MNNMSYDEMMKKVNGELTDELINEVIKETGIKKDVQILDDNSTAHNETNKEVTQHGE